MSSTVKRIITFIFLFILVSSTAQSCNLPGLNLFNSQNNNIQYTYGVLKKRPSDTNIVPQESKTSFGFINTIKSGDTENVDALASFKTTKFEAYNSDKLFVLTSEKGLFISENSGRFWERKYIFEVSSDKENENDKINEINTKIEKNDAFFAKNFAIKDENTYYVSGQDKDKRGKIFKTTDNGNKFTQVYSELDINTSVDLITIDSNNSEIIYGALTGGAIIKSVDGGRNWQKIQAFKQTPVQIGFVAKQNNTFFALFARDGLKTSKNGGLSWESIEIGKTGSQIGENQNITGINLNPLRGDEKFGEFTKIIPVTENVEINAGQFPALLIADKQAWLSNNIFDKRSFSKIPLPVQNEQNNINDIAINPSKGFAQLFVAVNDKLLISNDSGKSWNVDDNLKINQNTNLGSIYSINFDPNNSDVMYLTISAPNSTKRTGLLG